MKQPQLGKAIAELRLSKGLTQEELVDKCNISVRTIQRIESGEVTPRSYTLKTIFLALDYDYSKLVRVSTESEAPKKALNALMIGFISGIIYFLVGVPEGFLEAARMVSSVGSHEITFIGNDIYVLIKVIVVLSFAGFMYGFYQIAKIYKSDFLMFSTILNATIILLASIANITTLYTDIFSEAGVIFLEILFFSIAGVILGVALISLRKQVGDIALIAGVMEIVVAICLITYIFSLLSLIIYIPTLVIELILIYQVRRKLTSSEEQ